MTTKSETFRYALPSKGFFLIQPVKRKQELR